ncbi:hypothetical protein HP556_15960 [Tardiphaga robiniae]|nr:hypothetical protein [Tardiphaga robiniae]
MLKWDSLPDRDRKWSAFQRDPNWVLKRTESGQRGRSCRTSAAASSRALRCSSDGRWQLKQRTLITHPIV